MCAVTSYVFTCLGHGVHPPHCDLGPVSDIAQNEPKYLFLLCWLGKQQWHTRRFFALCGLVNKSDEEKYSPKLVLYYHQSWKRESRQTGIAASVNPAGSWKGERPHPLTIPIHPHPCSDITPTRKSTHDVHMHSLYKCHSCSPPKKHPERFCGRVIKNNGS